MAVKTKNILLISSEYPPGPGGIGNHAYSLTKALAGKGFKVFVLTNAEYVDPERIKEFDSE